MSREVAVEVPAAIRFLPMIRWILPLLRPVVGLSAAPAPASADGLEPASVSVRVIRAAGPEAVPGNEGLK